LEDDDELISGRARRATSDSESFNYYYADDSTPSRSSGDPSSMKLDASVISALRHVQFQSDQEAQTSRPRYKGRRQRRNIPRNFAQSLRPANDDDDESFSDTQDSFMAPTLSTLRRTAVVQSDLRKSIVMDLCELEVTTKVKDWLSSFRSLDPRYQILNFFNDLALEGVEDFETRVRGGMLKDDHAGRMPKILRGFIKAGIFSVWRPTSRDAIRKMITGEGTGKGLDIKGKSAKRGEYSGYVPFLQIHDNAHKAKIGRMTNDKRVRVFYPNKFSRDLATQKLRRLSDDIDERGSAAARRVEEEEEFRARILKFRRETLIKSYTGNGDKTELMKSVSKIDDDVPQGEMKNIDEDLTLINRFCMQDGSVHYIDDYASKGTYGICIPEKVFWEGYVVPNDITRVPGSKDDTGRPSMPEFQQMNFDTLRNWNDKSQSADNGNDSSESFVDPRPVLWHGGCGKVASDNCDPLDPLGLLMAYEENGNVIPVVSDFDCFLLGTRGVRYHEPLGAQELSMLSMCIDDIEGILATPKEGSSWTMRWLEVKKKHAMCKTVSHEMPRFGYADPRSYKIMTGAVHRLEANGAVRHGPECFNYGFPQDLDDQYLVVSDSFPKIPWRYTDSKGLIEILSTKIDEGYTFPLNPKWILCDPGWKKVFDKSLASQKANVQDSMNIWYPDEIRRRIHEISAKYPDGYVDSGRSGTDTGVQVDLAGLELHRYKVKLKTKEKLRRAFSLESITDLEVPDETMTDVQLKTRREASVFRQAMHQVVEVEQHKKKNLWKKNKKIMTSVYNMLGKK